MSPGSIVNAGWRDGDSTKRDELCKDASALANSAGGQIVYGIEEKDHKPVRVDEGTQITREWIEQVRCLVPGFDGAIFSDEWKEALWARFFTEARARRSL
jgi:hypothetical protein